MSSAAINIPATAHDSAAHEHDDGAVHPHIMPPWLLLTIYFSLVILTIATVAVAYVDLGNLNIWAALIIAVVKASLVVLYFMHLKYDSPFNGVALITALLFVAVFIGTTMMDSGEYKTNYDAPGTRMMMTSQNGL